MVRPVSVLHVLGLLIVIFGLAMLLPFAISILHVDAAREAWYRSVAITLVGGAVLWAATRFGRGELQPRDGMLLVALVWTVLPAFATLPLMFHLPQLGFTDAYFETVAGLTTTGSTVLSGLDRLPPSINFWRCELQWIGGMGIIVPAVAILPLLGIGGSQIMRAETPGPMKDTRLAPRIVETAKGLWLGDAALSLACPLGFTGWGMSWVASRGDSFTI